MLNKTLASIAVTTALFAGPAFASGWTKNVDICAAAAESEGVVEAGDYRAKFVRGSGAAVKTVAIELIPNNGDAVTAECRIRRGEVTEFTIRS
ncbi:MAG: hypothetical protein AAFW68_01855 [Pseudomonadota bacterium]